VILLLAIAVILPTVCLLYFMAQAAENDRLAMRQKMIDFYTKKINEVFLMPDGRTPTWREYWGKIELTDENLDSLLFPIPFSNMGHHGKGFVIYGPNDVMVYPVMDNLDSISEFDDIFKAAYAFEFQDANIPAAIDEYKTIQDKTKDDRVKFIANIATARCLNKIGEYDSAIELAKKLSHLESKTIPKRLASDILKARVMFATLLKKHKRNELKDYFPISLLNGPSRMSFPTETRIWAYMNLKKVLNDSAMVIASGFSETIGLEQLAVSAAEVYPNVAALGKWPQFSHRQIQANPRLYGIHYQAGKTHFLEVFTNEKMVWMWEHQASRIEDEMVFCRIYDDQGQLIAGEPRLYRGIEVKLGWKFLEIVPGENYPDWKVEFYFYTGTFSDAARRQRVIYIWTGILLISLILTVSGFAGKSILRQAKLNTLKNDFIATVTHELKTPLASMRVLVDTLLEGSYNDQRQAVEYLGLISKENKRLTGLIDNFLTFSRMERNKQAFDIVDCPAADIVNDAAAAVKTKLSEKNCRFSVTISDDVASIYADKDAMVTVLVNLLDNAYKYSDNEKVIELSVYNENNNVCFAVKDNGIGMSPKVQKKVFERFYQADSKLSRTAEGCGLGLSIVKFILDAHEATVDVQSTPGKGSIFTVKLQSI